MSFFEFNAGASRFRAAHLEQLQRMLQLLVCRTSGPGSGKDEGQIQILLHNPNDCASKNVLTDTIPSGASKGGILGEPRVPRAIVRSLGVGSSRACRVQVGCHNATQFLAATSTEYLSSYVASTLYLWRYCAE